jgi:hypothetical protein
MRNDRQPVLSDDDRLLGHTGPEAHIRRVLKFWVAMTIAVALIRHKGPGVPDPRTSSIMPCRSRGIDATTFTIYAKQYSANCTTSTCGCRRECDRVCPERSRLDCCGPQSRLRMREDQGHSKPSPGRRDRTAVDDSPSTRRINPPPEPKFAYRKSSMRGFVSLKTPGWI